jgi:glucose-6-phosphate dehydrogenase assembly protein OpcA
VHIAEVDGDANPLAGLAAFRAFQEGVAERCDEPPAASQLREVDSFRLFDR